MTPLNTLSSLSNKSAPISNGVELTMETIRSHFNDDIVDYIDHILADESDMKLFDFVPQYDLLIMSTTEGWQQGKTILMKLSDPYECKVFKEPMGNFLFRHYETYPESITIFS